MAGRETRKRKEGHGSVREVGWSRGRGRGQKGRQKSETESAPEPKEDECRTKKRALLQETLGVMG